MNPIYYAMDLSTGFISWKKRKEEKTLVKQHLWNDMRAIGVQGKDCKSCLGNSKKANHATKAVFQHVYKHSEILNRYGFILHI